MMGVFGSLGIVALAALVSAGLILVLRPLLVRYASARPNARSSHTVPTPQGGGIAVVLALLLATGAGMLLLPGTPRGDLLPLLAAAVLLAVVGAVDDIVTSPPLPRLIMQFVAVACVVGLLPGEIRAAPQLPLLLERALLVVIGVWFVNLTNFMDGIDWMTVAEVVPLTIGIALLALMGAAPGSAALAALALLGAVIGFAPFNRPVAKLFLGDVGSLPIGLLLFWLVLAVAAQGHLVAASLLPLYYLADATITLLRRAARGENVLEAHRTHFYQIATKGGFSAPEVIARVFAVNGLLVVLAVASAAISAPAAKLLALVLGAAAVGWLLLWMQRGKAGRRS
jgi:UDP-N-acetylmuramyl pentapeptide phosphotransferase/UDP-N-acetylglucosamine-1-phosphate transferase